MNTHLAIESPYEEQNLKEKHSRLSRCLRSEDRAYDAKMRNKYRVHQRTVQEPENVGAATRGLQVKNDRAKTHSKKENWEKNSKRACEPANIGADSIHSIGIDEHL